MMQQIIKTLFFQTATFLTLKKSVYFSHIFHNGNFYHTFPCLFAIFKVFSFFFLSLFFLSFFPVQFSFLTN